MQLRYRPLRRSRVFATTGFRSQHFDRAVLQKGSLEGTHVTALEFTAITVMTLYIRHIPVPISNRIEPDTTQLSDVKH